MFLLILSVIIILILILFSVKLVSDKKIIFSYKELAEQKIQRCKNTFQLSKEKFIKGIHFYKIDNIPLINKIEKLPSQQLINYYKNLKIFNKSDPMLISIFNALNISQKQIDEFFEYSANELWNGIHK